MAVELALQLDLPGIDMQLQWVPRAQNQPADDLTNDHFDDFEAKSRVEVDLETLPLQVMIHLLKKAGTPSSGCSRLQKRPRKARCGGRIHGEDCRGSKDQNHGLKRFHCVAKRVE